MPIRFDKLLVLLQSRKTSIYKLKTDKIIGTATIDKLRKGEGHIDTRTIDSLCEYLHCQPGDIMEHIPSEETDTGETV